MKYVVVKMVDGCRCDSVMHGNKLIRCLERYVEVKNNICWKRACVASRASSTNVLQNSNDYDDVDDDNNDIDNYVDYDVN